MVCILGEMMTSKIYSEFNWPLSLVFSNLTGLWTGLLTEDVEASKIEPDFCPLGSSEGLESFKTISSHETSEEVAPNWFLALPETIF